MPTVCGLPVKWVSLVLLTFVTTWTVFSIKLARASSKAYINSTVVLFTELLKLVLSFLLLALEKGSMRDSIRLIVEESSSNFSGVLKLCVPGLAYTIQNNLIFLSVDLLSAAVQQVTYQLKILTAALLSVTFLGRRVGLKKWISLFVLVAGVVLVQIPRDFNSRELPEADLEQSSSYPGLGMGRALLGFCGALGACFASGFGGVYMEMVLKGSPRSIWLRNVQLAVFGASSAALGVLFSDREAVFRDGLTQGYTPSVWLMAFTVASGGLLVAAVLKYADNILRQFSTAISVILTTGLSAYVLHEISLDAMFGMGASLTIFATFMYSGVLDKFLPLSILG